MTKRIYLHSLLFLVVFFGLIFFASPNQVWAATCVDCALGCGSCGVGYKCVSGNDCNVCTADSSCGNTPTPTEQQQAKPTPTPPPVGGGGGSGGGGSNITPTELLLPLGILPVRLIPVR